MILLARFLVYNLLISLAGGLLAWLVVVAVLRLLGIRSSALSFCFLGLPLFKSLLLLLGIGLVLPWPIGVFGQLHDRAVTYKQVLPLFLFWTGFVCLIFYFTIQKLREEMLREAQPAAEVAPRLQSAFEAVWTEFKQRTRLECNDDLCMIRIPARIPPLMVSERIQSPLVIYGREDETILFPTGLVSRLNEAELAGALAHELAHLVLRRPDWCSAGTLQQMTWIVPLAGAVGEYLHHLEEKACDGVAVSIVGEPRQYAGMLTKCFRFSRESPSRRIRDWLQVLPRLIGFKPLLSERVEELVDPKDALWGRMPPRWLVWTAWAALLYIFFIG